jgi:hypothetical protein
MIITVLTWLLRKPFPKARQARPMNFILTLGGRIIPSVFFLTDADENQDTLNDTFVPLELRVNLSKL